MDVSSGFRLVLGPPAALEDAFLAAVAAARETVLACAGRRPCRRRPPAPVPAAPDRRDLARPAQRPLLDARRARVYVWASRRSPRPGRSRCRRSPSARTPPRSLAAARATSPRSRRRRVSPRPRVDSLRELRREGVVRDAFERVAPSSLESAAKAEDLARSIGGYLEGRRGYYDGEDALAVADPRRFDGVELMLVGVWRLGANARRLIQAIAAARPGHRLPAFSRRRRRRSARRAPRWLPRSGRRGRGTEARVRRRTALARLQAHLFVAERSGRSRRHRRARLRARPARRDARGRARLPRVGGRRDRVPGDGRHLPPGGGVPPAVEAVFAEAGIPVYLDDGPSLAERPLGRRILALLDLIDSPLRRRDVMAFLSDGRMPKRDARALRRRARRSLGLDLAPRGRRRRARAVAQPARPPARARGGGRSRGGRTRVARSAASRTATRCSPSSRSSPPTSPRAPSERSWSESLVLPPRAARDVRATAPTTSSATSTSSPSSTRSSPRWSSRASSTSCAPRSRRSKAGDLDEGQQGAFGRRGVNVLDVNQLRNLRFRAVAVLGLTERAFPPPPRQDPLLLDDERVRLNEAGGFDLPLRARGADPEPLQFALAVHAARERAASLDPPRRGGGRPRAAAVVVLPRCRRRARGPPRDGGRGRARLRRVRHLPAGRVGAGTLERALTRRRARPHAARARPGARPRACSSGSSRELHAPTPCAARAGRRAA